MMMFLNKLSKYEMKKFDRFVHSEYFNVNRKVTLLFEYLHSLYPDIESDDVTLKALSAVTGESKMSSLNYRKLISDFIKLFERFLAQEEIEIDSRLTSTMLLKALRKKELENRFERNFNEIARASDNEFSKDGDYYLARYRIFNERFYWQYGEKKFEYSPLLQEMSDNIDLHFVFEKLHMFNQMYHNSFSENSNEKYRREFYDEVMQYVEDNLENLRLEHPNIYIIYLTLKMFENDDEKAMKELLLFLKDVAKSFAKDNLAYYYNYVTTFCLNKVNLGILSFRKIALDLYKKMNELDLLEIDGTILDTDFNNAVNLALAEGEVEWTDKFIEQNKDRVDARFAKDAYHLAKAKVHFYNKEFEKMFRLMESVEYKDPLYYINAKILLGRVYIDSKDFVFARYVYDNLNQYRRVGTGLSESQRDSIRRFLKYFGGLLKLGDPGRKKKNVLRILLLEQLRKEESYVPTKTWLEEKLSSEIY